jgi:hypothetical protein
LGKRKEFGIDEVDVPSTEPERRDYNIHYPVAVSSPALGRTKRRRTDGYSGDVVLDLAPVDSQSQRTSFGPATFPPSASMPVSQTQTQESSMETLDNGIEREESIPHGSFENGRREDTVIYGDAEPPIPLIDTFPRNKQRHIYGIVSGLQGGIEHLQKELEMLKKALGIHEEE